MPMKRVIIVDDALDLGRVLQTLMLTVSTELSISVVPSAEEAVLEASRRPVELLVSDIRLPGISGLELVKKIRQKQPGVKVIFITGLSDGPVVQQAHTIELVSSNLLYGILLGLLLTWRLRSAGATVDRQAATAH